MTAPTSAPRGRIALTGAAGSLARDIIPHLRRCGYELVCLDQAESADPMGCEWVIASIHDADRLREAFAGCAAVVHLAGIPLEASWEEISRTNIDGTQAVLEAARAARVPKAVLASSIHATGYTPVPAEGDLLPDDVPVRPNTFYGVSKAAVEALGSVYADRYGLDVVCLRIASRFARPENERMLSTWLSPADAGRLFEAALSGAATGFRIVWGVSRNTRGYLSPDGGRAIGFFPEDDAEAHADELPADASGAAQGSEWDRRCIGGVFSSPEPPMFSPPVRRVTTG
ncbi:NAD-dependent epimerase/dehydratase family protein [Sinomonas sp. RB5]